MKRKKMKGKENPVMYLTLIAFCPHFTFHIIDVGKQLIYIYQEYFFSNPFIALM